MITLKIVNSSQIDALLPIAIECFLDDPFYKNLSYDPLVRKKRIGEIFKKSFYITLKSGFILAFFDGEQPIAFSSWINFHDLKEQYPESFDFIFPSEKLVNKYASRLAELSETAEILDMVSNFPLCLYLIAVGVKKEFRRKGLATSLIKRVINAYPFFTLCSDISNPSSLPIYLNNGFILYKQINYVSLIVHPSPDATSAFESSTAFLALPEESDLNNSIFKDSVKKSYKIAGISASDNKSAFKSCINDIECKINVIEVSYHLLIKYQGIINIFNFEETVIEVDNRSVLFYFQLTRSETGYFSQCAHRQYGIRNNIELISSKEYDLSSDVLIQVPVTYQKKKLYNFLDINKPVCTFSRKLLKALKFRTNYESGNPNNELNDYGFKARIQRFYIGNFFLQLHTEKTISFNCITTVEPIDQPIEISILISIDCLSDSGVITIAIPSCKLPVSQILDSVSRNQIMILTVGNNVPVSLLSYLWENFGIIKSGSPKTLLTIFDDRANISDEYIGALLFGETFYEDNTGLGKVVDNKIINMIHSEFGVAQYNYATVYCYKNMVIQMTSRFRSSINERIIQESITLFYMELILLEESAIISVEQHISKFLNKLDYFNNSTVLANINTILSNYAKSSDFWDIRMNYPSSRKSVEEIRNAFQISKLRLDVSTKKETLLNICTIRDTILEETEGYFISIIGIIVAAFSCADLINSNHLRQIIGFVLILISLFLALRYRMNRKIRFNK